MDKTVIIKQIEFYSNTIVAFVVLQGMGYCYYFGTNELFNRLVKQTSDLSLGLLFILSCSLVFGSVATIYLRKQAEKLIDKPHHDLIRHLYLAKLLIVMLFGLCLFLLLSALPFLRFESMNKHEKINYVEFPANDLEAVKAFFSAVFDWSFIDYGSEYTAFSDQGIDGGFYKSELSSSAKNGSALIVFYSESLENTQQKIETAGGNIIQAIFSFPGGRRFHFTDPAGNEYAVWSDKS